MFFVMNSYAVALSLSLSPFPCPQPSKHGNFSARSLTVSIIFVITRMIDGGTIPDQDSGSQVQVPNSPPTASQGLIFQDWLQLVTYFLQYMLPIAATANIFPAVHITNCCNW